MQAKKRRLKQTKNVWYWLTMLCFTAALAAIIVLLISDVLRHLQFTVVHQRLAALPLMLIGLSYVCLQMSARHPRAELVKGLLLGLAFILWGSELLLPPTPWVTVMDGVVVTIFVVDLSVIIWEHLQRKDHDLP